MVNTFIELCNRSIQACYLIIAIIILRLIWKRVPKLLYRYLWCLVGLRHALPFTLETALSLIPQKTVIEPEIVYSQKPMVDSGIVLINQAVNPVITEHFTPDVTVSVNPLQVGAAVGTGIWLVGMLLLIMYSLISYIRLHHQMRDAVLLKENIYQSEKVSSPFVFGFLKPRIYLPYSLTKENLDYVIAHEKMHIKNRDYLLKPIAFVIASIYWFNPLVWMAYYLFCKDLELSCDEWVIWNLPLEEKKAYAKALVTCSVDKRFGYISPLAFGENAVKQRIQNVLRYKNPSLWVFIGICMVVLIAVLCFMTNPREDEVVYLPDEEIIITEVADDSKPENATEHHYGVDASDSVPSTETAKAVPILLKEPPLLGFSDMLSSQMNQFVVSNNGCSWTYIDAPLTEEGVYDFSKGNEVGIAATGLYPTVAAKLVDWLTLPQYQGVDTWLYRLTSDVKPDEVIVREYSLYELGNENAEVRSERRYTKDMLLIELLPARVYEITAIWDKAHYEECGYYGEAYYVLVTDAMMKSATIEAHIKEIYDNKILISSDEDDFPGAFEVIVPEHVYNINELHGGQSIQIEMYDTGVMNENGKIPVYTAVSIRNLIIEEPEEISLDEIVMDANSYVENNLEGVTLQMEEYDSRSGEVEILNETDMDIQFGEWFEIQVLMGNAWVKLPYVIDSVAFNEPAYNAPKDETAVWEVQWEWIYGELPEGTYRIIKDVMDFRGTGDFTKYYLADEFEIK